MACNKRTMQGEALRFFYFVHARFSHVLLYQDAFINEKTNNNKNGIVIENFIIILPKNLKYCLAGNENEL
jgi:hypothetical protein